MARSIEDIKTEMLIVKNNDPVLVDIDTESNSAPWRAIIYMISFIINTLEKILDVFKSEVYSRIEASQPGVLSWYVQKAKEFQVNDLLNSQTLSYDIVSTDKQIIYYASAQENLRGGITLKIAKEDTYLSDNELRQFVTYMELQKFAGVQISYVSIMPDVITIDAVFFYNPSVSESIIRDLISNTIKGYFQEVGFDGTFRVNDLITRLRLLSEIDDVKINQVEVVQNLKSSIIDLSYQSVSGRFLYNENGSILQLTPVL